MVLGGLLGSSLRLWQGPKALEEDTVMVLIISLDPLGRPKEAMLFSARQEGPGAQGRVAPWPGSAVTAQHQPVPWEVSALTEVDLKMPCSICYGPKGRVPSLVCLAPIQGGLVGVHVVPLWQTGLSFASAQSPLGCGPEIRPAAAGAPSQTAGLPSGTVGSRCQS